ncbi:MAG TPA: hypothetical protein VGG38_12430 [Acidimicrobiales bacterium]
MSKSVSTRDSGSSVSVHHVGAMLAVGVVGAIVAFWLLSSIIGIIAFLIKVVVVVALIGGAFWVVSRLRH